jgi:hypothetical protein
MIRAEHVVRGLLAVAILAGAIALAAPIAERVVGTLHAAASETARSGPHQRHPHRVRGAAASRRAAQDGPARTAGTVERVLVKVAIALGILLAATAAVGALIAAPRLRARRRRRYEAFRIHLTGNDQTSLGNLVQAAGAMGDAIAQWPRDRARHGQPAFGFLVAYDPRKGGEVTLAVVCVREHAAALDGALQQAYPNVRIGHQFAPEYRPLDVRICPPALIRLRKRREPFHPVIDLEGRRGDVSSVSEGIAEMLHSLKQPAAVWFCCVPANSGSGYLRKRHRRSERFRRSREGSLRSGEWRDREPEPSVDREEARQSAEIAEGATFFVDAQIAGPDYQTCKALHAKLRNLPGARNELVRRPMIWRRGLYRRRFQSFTPPLVLRGAGKVMTASEMAGLLELPSARLKTPVARLTLPRVDAPPKAVQGIGRSTGKHATGAGAQDGAESGETLECMLALADENREAETDERRAA